MTAHNPLGLSSDAYAVLKALVERDTSGTGWSTSIRAILREFGFNQTQTEDVVRELESKGLLEVKTAASGATVLTTHLAPSALAGDLPFEPLSEVRVVADALCTAGGSVTGTQLQNATGLDPRRLNLAVRYLEGEGLADVQHALGQSDFCFASASATYETRQFVKQ